MEKKPHVGCDWTRLLINHTRWYLLILIDFFSPYIISYVIFPSINASHVKHIYRIGLNGKGIREAHDILPELVTKELTDNAFTERFFGTAKQE